MVVRRVEKIEMPDASIRIQVHLWLMIFGELSLQAFDGSPNTLHYPGAERNLLKPVISAEIRK